MFSHSFLGNPALQACGWKYVLETKQISLKNHFPDSGYLDGLHAEVGIKVAPRNICCELSHDKGFLRSCDRAS